MGSLPPELTQQIDTAPGFTGLKASVNFTPAMRFEDVIKQDPAAYSDLVKYKPSEASSMASKFFDKYYASAPEYKSLDPNEQQGVKSGFFNHYDLTEPGYSKQGFFGELGQGIENAGSINIYKPPPVQQGQPFDAAGRMIGQGLGTIGAGAGIAAGIAALPVELPALGVAAGTGAIYGGISNAMDVSRGQQSIPQAAVNTGIDTGLWALPGGKTMLGSMLKQGIGQGVGGAVSYGANQALTGQDIDPRMMMQVAAQQGIMGAGLGAGVHAGAEMMNRPPAVESGPEPDLKATVEKTVSRDDTSEQSHAEQLYHSLRSPNLDEQLAAKNTLSQYRKLSQVKVSGRGETMWSKNPAVRQRQELSQRVMQHYENYSTKQRFEQQNQRLIERAKAQQVIKDNRAEVKTQHEQAKREARRLKDDIIARNKQIKEAQKQLSKKEETTTLFGNAIKDVVDTATKSKEGRALEKGSPDTQDKKFWSEKLKTLTQANKEAQKQLSKAEKAVTLRAKILEEDNANTKDVLSTRLSMKEGVGYQHESGPRDLEFIDIESQLDRYPKELQVEVKKWAKTIDSVMQKDGQVQFPYRAEESGHTSTAPEKTVTPFAWFATRKGVGFRAYNENGHESMYYLHTDQNGSRVLGEPVPVENGKPFLGTKPNVYKGSRFYNIDDVLNRPERDPELLHSELEEIIQSNPQMETWIKEHPKTPISFIRNMVESLNAQGDLAYDHVVQGYTEMTESDYRQAEKDLGCI